jgi:hypothetical protein
MNSTSSSLATSSNDPLRQRHWLEAVELSVAQILRPLESHRSVVAAEALAGQSTGGRVLPAGRGRTSITIPSKHAALLYPARRSFLNNYQLLILWYSAPFVNDRKVNALAHHLYCPRFVHGHQFHFIAVSVFAHHHPHLLRDPSKHTSNFREIAESHHLI